MTEQQGIVINKISKEDIKILDMVGTGSAGKVYKGFYNQEGK